MRKSEHYNNLVKLITKLSYRHSSWKVFSDFVEISAISISNSVDWIHKDSREKKYFEIIGQYEKQELELLAQMFAELVMALEAEVSVRGPTDILGSLYHELELHNKWTGQFFTPVHVSEAMGMMVAPDKKELIEKKGFIRVAEPCVGSGSMIIGFANALKSNKIDYTSKMVVTATDIDEKCVHMAYIQLSLYGIPAIVIHGNSITMQEWSKWYTPIYMLNGWAWKRQEDNTSKEPSKDKKEVISNKVNIVEQMSMFDFKF